MGGITANRPEKTQNTLRTSESEPNWDGKTGKEPL